MTTDALPITPVQASRLLIAIQAGDAVACAIPLELIQQDLERLGCPHWLQRTLPVVKGASAVGLLAGRRHARLGRLTADALVAYFLCALGAHARVRDPAWRWAPAAGMLALTFVARRAYADEQIIDLTPETGTIDVPAPQVEAAATADDGAAALASVEPADA